MDAVKNYGFLKEISIFPSDEDKSKRKLYCIKCYDKKTKKRTLL